MTGRVPLPRAVAAVEDACAKATNADELIESVDSALRKAVPYDGATWFGTDPATLLSTTPTRIEGIEAGHCDSFWHREFHVEDAMLFRDLARASEPVASLRDVTDDRPMRSARFREFLAPQGYDDEMRGVFRLGEAAWGITGLYREKGRPAFTSHDRAVLSSVVGTVAGALRRHVTAATPWQMSPMSPGLLMFDAGDTLVSTNAEADAWIAEMDPGTYLSPVGGSRRWVVPPPRGASVVTDGFPPSIIALVARARAVARGHEKGPARLRLRSRTGQWIVVHASCMSGAADGSVAVMLEPAKSSDIAPIIVEAYALSPRERDVVRAIARGLSSAEIAAELFLSPHTVRDYVKSVFEKIGVSSRGELVAKLFAEHYSDALHAGALHV
jgi:DNA-binding CsgD family transcriptional regulator